MQDCNRSPNSFLSVISRFRRSMSVTVVSSSAVRFSTVSSSCSPWRASASRACVSSAACVMKRAVMAPRLISSARTSLPAADTSRFSPNCSRIVVAATRCNTRIGSSMRRPIQ